MNKIHLPVWLAVLAGVTLMLTFTAPTQARPPVSVHVGIGVHYPGPVRAWHHGYWHRGWYGPRFGWGWVAGPSWYGYPGPVYSYPEPYFPPVVIQTVPAKPGPAPAQYWYYCVASKAYYPYVAECPGGWQPVPATPTPPSLDNHPGR